MRLPVITPLLADTSMIQPVANRIYILHIFVESVISATA